LSAALAGAGRDGYAPPVAFPVRLAAADDLPRLLALYRHLHADEPPLPADRAEAVWREMLEQPNHKVFVIDGEGELASSCTVTIIPGLARGARPYAVIENVVTHAAYRQRGLGGAVVKAAVAAAWEADAYKVFLTTGSQRESTLRFYEKLGFTKNGRTLFDIRRI
jgi:ribosomal protein S18 acetylase RimI-like enzyme